MYKNRVLKTIKTKLIISLTKIDLLFSRITYRPYNNSLFAKKNQLFYYVLLIIHKLLRIKVVWQFVT